MDRLNRFNEQELEQRLDLNYSFVTGFARIVNQLKGYEVGYSSPKKGKMIINHEGQNYIVDVEPIVDPDGKELSLAEAMKRFGYIFN